MADPYDYAYEAGHDKKVKSWLRKIAQEEKEHCDFRKEAKKAVDIHQRSGDDGKKVKFPMYTANVTILKSALFSKMPRPDVRRPYQNRGDSDLAEAIQRGIEHLQDVEDYSMPAHRAVEEWLAGGLGVLWYRYETEFVEMPVMVPLLDDFGDPVIGPDGLPVMTEARDENGKLITEELIESQTITQEYHPYYRFRWEPAVVWEDVEWISFDFVKTAAQIKADYGKEINNYDSKNKDKAKSADDKGGHIVHHIWDKKNRKVKVITPAHKSCLAEYDDPLGLEGFYPCPRPLMTNVLSGKITPRPDYVFIETQHDNIQVLTTRINSLTSGIKDIGFYEATLFEELAGLEKARDGKMIPVVNMLEKLGGRDAGNIVVSIDNTNKVATLEKLRQQREDEKNTIYEVQGIADIVRGVSVASETAYAQSMKDKHFNVRLSSKIGELRRFWRDSYRILTEIMGEHFTAESFAVFTGLDLSDEQLDALKNELGRSYMIDVETEDTTFEDDEKERAQGIELLGTLDRVILNHYPAVQAGTLPADFFQSLITFASGLFKDGRMLEEGIQSLPDSTQQLAQLQQTMQEMQAQTEQLSADNQALQQQLAEAQGSLNQIETAKAGSDIQAQGAKAQRDLAEAEQTRLQTAIGAV